MLRDLMLPLRIGILAGLLYVGWVFLHRALTPVRRPVQAGRQEQAARAAEFERIYGGTAVRIIHFYAPEASVTEGENSVICYGVVNARSVRMEPPLDGVAVSLNKCVAVTGERATRYTLIAEGNDGTTVSESFVLGVHADPYTLPKVTSFRVVNKTLNYVGDPVYLLSYTAANPEEVSFDPPVFRTLKRAPYGSFYVAPKTTTTYTLTVIGKRGHRDTAQLTLEGPKK